MTAPGRETWFETPAPRWVGGNQVQLLEGGDQLFPVMCDAIGAAEREVWLATYIFHNDGAARRVADALAAAARRGVAVHVVVDGFGSMATLEAVRDWLVGAGVQFEVFRAIDRWWRWLQPGQLRRLHQKVCVVDEHSAFVGGINVIDDRNDLRHGWSEVPRLDFAVALQGPLTAQVRHAVRAMWTRAHLRHYWRDELQRLARSGAPLGRTVDLLRGMGAAARGAAPPQAPLSAARASFVVRDNLRQRRAIEHRYIEAMRQARHHIDIACPYFYPGNGFRRALRKAARRGVQVRLLLQGKLDYRIAGLAARVLYDELRAHGVRIFEYTPAFLHAKVARVDDHWATVGSSNIDPLSLLLNLEANVIVRDAAFTQALALRLETAFAQAVEITTAQPVSGWRQWLRRGFVAWLAHLYLRVAGVTGRY
ncbi:MAG: cardiolipin synthase ClsB [Rubrivivax sp.]|nr:cardiolipin synthase ClsB [Rubrivivax sp.]